LISSLALASFSLTTWGAEQEDLISALIRNDQFKEAQEAIDARLKLDANDATALHGLADLALDDRTGSDEQLAKVIPRLEACIAAKPTAAPCQIAYGNALGTQAMKAGLMAGMRSVGKIKDAYLAAVAADPTGFEARESLIRFYLMAPGVAGGSVKEARKNADAFAAIDPVRAHLLRADIAIYQEHYADAEAELKAIPLLGDAASRLALAGRWQSLGYSYLNDKQYPAAKTAFDRGTHDENPDIVSHAHFGLGRLALAQNHSDEAIAEINKAMGLDHWINGHFRLGMAFEQKGDKAHALAEYQAFLQFKPAPKGDLAEEARKRVDNLRS
jgi:tetratricopeptide (TPR) repeat protein